MKGEHVVWGLGIAAAAFVAYGVVLYQDTAIANSDLSGNRALPVEETFLEKSQDRTFPMYQDSQIRDNNPKIRKDFDAMLDEIIGDALREMHRQNNEDPSIKPCWAVRCFEI